MSLTPIKASSKPKKPIHLKPNRMEGYHIQFELKCLSNSFVSMAGLLGISPPSVRNVVFGRRRSARIEAEIARLLGKADWNEVVLEARAAVTGKSLKTIQQEIVCQRAERNKAALERLSAAMDADRASKARRAG